MTGRSIIGRVEKLEAARRDADEVLLIWIRPRADVDAALRAALDAGIFSRGDKVLCAEWLGECDPPGPKWSRRFPSELTDAEIEYCYATLQKLTGDRPAQVSGDSMMEVPTETLWQFALGVRA